MTKTKIDWCDYTWNPVWGCYNDCPYCYARKLARRFGNPNFLPTWKQNSFDQLFPKKPSRIFIGSMSDICWWDREWMHGVLDKVKKNPIHIYLFLTKKPSIYSQYVFPENCWLGTTVTNQSEMLSFADLIFETTWDEMGKIYFSFEPILERIELFVNPDWIIIGAETGNRKDKVIPKREWIAEIVDYCKAGKIPVFLKESLREIWAEQLIQEFPGGKQ